MSSLTVSCFMNKGCHGVLSPGMLKILLNLQGKYADTADPTSNSECVPSI